MALLLACQPGPKTGSRGCTDVQLIADDSSAILSTPPIVPAGGFVHVGNRACTATFLLNKSTDTSLELSVYTAQHCFQEDDVALEDVGISVHLPATSKTSAGYIKNLKARDEFYARRKAFLSEVQKLSSAEAKNMAQRAMEITLFAQRGIESLSPQTLSEKLTDEGSFESDDYQRNVCISSSKDKLKVAGSHEVCWSTFDSTIRTFEIRSENLSAAQYSSIRKHLEQKKREHESFLASSKTISSQFNSWNERLKGQVGAWRMLNYIEIASFLNKEVCSKYLSKDDPNQSICAVRDQMIALANRYLVESDTDGKRKSILDQANELGLGIDTPYLRTLQGTTTAVKLRDQYQQKASDKFYAMMSNRVNELMKMFPLNGDKFNSLPKQLSIAANPVITSEGGRMSFALVASSALLPNNSPIPSKGVQTFGHLRMYLPAQSSKVKFGPTDSGAMLTFAGVVPLLVLNTVDDKPTSGGTAILALPEIAEEDESLNKTRTSSNKIARVSTMNSADTRVDSTDALVSNKTSVCN